MSVLQKLLSILFLKSAPQDLPYSPQLGLQLSAFYIFSGLLVLQTTVAPNDMFAGILLGLLVQFIFTYTVLAALNKTPRFLQTFSALIGISLIFNLLSWPLFSILTNESSDDAIKATMSLLFLMLLSWEVLVKAYIFKHALEMKLFTAMALSFSLFFISVSLSQLLFPAQAGG